MAIGGNVLPTPVFEFSFTTEVNMKASNRSVRGILAASFALLVSASTSQAVQYAFLPVTATGALTSKFGSGSNVINVSQVFSAGGAGGQNNQNTAIFPSTFTTLFPGTGQVQGHLAQTVYNHTSDITFDLTGYSSLSQSLVFGIWNISDEVQSLPPGPAAYWIEVIDGASNPKPPSTWSFVGRQENTTQVASRHQMNLSTANGDLTFGALTNSGGTHTDAIFYDKLILPTGTSKIIVHANLPSLNTVGDGVGYYFADVVPEPTSLGVILAAGSLMIRRRR